MRGVRGGGSLYQRSDGQWVASVTLPTARGEARKRCVRYAPTREAAATKLGALLSEHGIAPRTRDDAGPNTIRAQHLEVARALGRHTSGEWHALCRAHGNRCYYCGRKGWHGAMLTKDHRVPITRGGSDAIDNIAPACRRCNSEKSDLTEEEFLRHDSREQRHERREAAEAQGRRLRLQARE